MTYRMKTPGTPFAQIKYTLFGRYFTLNISGTLYQNYQKAKGRNSYQLHRMTEISYTFIFPNQQNDENNFNLLENRYQ